jgi:hypothetical protein
MLEPTTAEKLQREFALFHPLPIVAVEPCAEFTGLSLRQVRERMDCKLLRDCKGSWKTGGRWYANRDDWIIAYLKYK